jgi:hypothetical protein
METFASMPQQGQRAAAEESRLATIPEPENVLYARDVLQIAGVDGASPLADPVFAAAVITVFGHPMDHSDRFVPNCIAASIDLH